MAGYSASGIGKRESSIRLGARQLSLVREKETDEDGPLAGEFNCNFKSEFNCGESQTNGFKHTSEEVECSEETPQTSEEVQLNQCVSKLKPTQQLYQL
jgi:hypothetical protein